MKLFEYLKRMLNTFDVMLEAFPLPPTMTANLPRSIWCSEMTGIGEGIISDQEAGGNQTSGFLQARKSHGAPVLGTLYLLIHNHIIKRSFVVRIDLRASRSLRICTT
jgi:hypothetical protein